MQVKIKTIKDDIIKQLPKGAKIEDMKKVAAGHFMLPNMPEDEYIIRISIDGDEDIFNNMYLCKGNKVINVHTSTIPIGDDAYV